jgi:hypothetical protein
MTSKRSSLAKRNEGAEKKNKKRDKYFHEN